MTSQETDLRNFCFMPLDVVQLRDSEMAAVEDPEAFRCALLLCCASWHQVPAASLPAQEGMLARLAGYGRDVRTFRRARDAGGMRGWILCSDGRYYHAMVAEKANAAYVGKKKQRARTAAATAIRVAKCAGKPSLKTSQDTEIKQDEAHVTMDLANDVTCNVTNGGTSDVTFTKGEGEERKGKERNLPRHLSMPALRRGHRSASQPLGTRMPISRRSTRHIRAAWRQRPRTLHG
jgi:hypothetical protein